MIIMRYVLIVLLAFFIHGCVIKSLLFDKAVVIPPAPEGVSIKYGSSYAHINFYDELIMETKLFGLWNTQYMQALYGNAFVIITFRKYNNQPLKESYLIKSNVLNIEKAELIYKNSYGVKPDDNGSFNITEALNNSKSNLVMIEYTVKGEPEKNNRGQFFNPHSKAINIENIYRDEQDIPLFGLKTCYVSKKNCIYYSRY